MEIKKTIFSPECFKSLFCYFLINRCTAIMFSIIYIQSHKTLITKRIMKVKRNKHSSYAEQNRLTTHVYYTFFLYLHTIILFFQRVTPTLIQISKIKWVKILRSFRTVPPSFRSSPFSDNRIMRRIYHLLYFLQWRHRAVKRRILRYIHYLHPIKYSNRTDSCSGRRLFRKTIIKKEPLQHDKKKYN